MLELWWLSTKKFKDSLLIVFISKDLGMVNLKDCTSPMLQRSNGQSLEQLTLFEDAREQLPPG